jgi:hypothetical protein
MGFRTGAFTKLWSIEPVRDTITKARVSISKKNKNTGEYESEFDGFIAFVGTAAASKAAKLKEGDRIKLGDVDVTRKYDKEKQKEYINFNVFSFEMADSKTSSSPPTVERTESVDSGEVETDDLPF